MEKADLEELRGKVTCSAVLEDAGFALDLKESSRKATALSREHPFFREYRLWRNAHNSAARDQ